MSEEQNSINAFGANTAGQDQMAPVDKRIKQSRDIAKWFFVISIVLMVISIAATLVSTSSSSMAQSELESTYEPDSSDTYDDSSWDTSWVPYDFNVWSADSNIAWKWTPSGDYECDDYSCVSAQFISRDGCPNGLYAAINWLDEYDSVVSYGNESLPSLLPMQTAQLKFDDFQDISDSGQMAEINCG